jgi:hypothetical protein
VFGFDVLATRFETVRHRCAQASLIAAQAFVDAGLHALIHLVHPVLLSAAEVMKLRWSQAVPKMTPISHNCSDLPIAVSCTFPNNKDEVRYAKVAGSKGRAMAAEFSSGADRGEHSNAGRFNLPIAEALQLRCGIRRHLANQR